MNLSYGFLCGIRNSEKTTLTMFSSANSLKGNISPLVPNTKNMRHHFQCFIELINYLYILQAVQSIMHQQHPERLPS